MMTRSLLKLSCIAGLLFIVPMLSFGTGEAVQISPKQMNDEPLVETLGDPKPGDIAFSNIVSRLEKGENDRNSSLAKQMANPKQMSDEQLVETLGDRKWEDIAFSELNRRLIESKYDLNSPLAKRLADTWRGTDEERIERIERRRASCFYALCMMRSQEVTDVLCRQLIEGGTRSERRMAAFRLCEFEGGIWLWHESQREYRIELGLPEIEVKSEEVAAVLHSAVVKDEGVVGQGRLIAEQSIYALGGMGSIGAKTLMELGQRDRSLWL